MRCIKSSSILFIKDISNTFNRGKEFQTPMLIGLVVLLLLFAYFVYSMLRRRCRFWASSVTDASSRLAAAVIIPIVLMLALWERGGTARGGGHQLPQPP